MPGLYFEEFAVGQKFEHALRRTVTEADNVLFSAMTHNPAPLHLDEEYMKGTEFGTRLVNSYFTLGLMVGISVQETTLGTTVANLAIAPTSPDGKVCIYTQTATNLVVDLSGYHT